MLLWDARERKSSLALANAHAVTCCAFSDDATKLFCGGIDDKISCWDLRNGEVEYVLQGHDDTVTGLSGNQSFEAAPFPGEVMLFR